MLTTLTSFISLARAGLLAVTTILVLTGCQSTSNKIAGICQIEESTDVLNETRVIKFTPCHMSIGETMYFGRHRTGFTYNERYPDNVVINVEFNTDLYASGSTYTSFDDMIISIDGTQRRFTFGDTYLDSSTYNSVSNTIYTQSAANTVVPLSYFKQMMASENVRIRINTRDGYTDYIFSEKERGMAKFGRFYLDEYMALLPQ